MTGALVELQNLIHRFDYNRRLQSYQQGEAACLFTIGPLIYGHTKDPRPNQQSKNPPLERLTHTLSWHIVFLNGEGHGFSTRFQH